MTILVLIISLAYLIIIGSLIIGFYKTSAFELKKLKPETKFSVLIPFRNESKNLTALLSSIDNLNYPKELFEVIFIDDESEDNSVNIIKTNNTQANTQIIKNERKTISPKKDAITTAIKKSKHEWLITTDADCVLPVYWLDTLNEYIKKTNAFCIAGPVDYFNSKGLLNQFQLLDLLSLQGATIGGFGIKQPFLCNGANLAYKKDVFFEINGFDGNFNIASGDDIFLLEKIANKYPSRLHYLKSRQAIVKTKCESSWTSLIAQRIRWAAKTSRYKNGFGKLTGGIVAVMNITFVVLTITVLLNTLNLKILAYVFLLKFILDLILISKSATFFLQQSAICYYPIAFIIYPFFSTYIAFLSIFKGYKWKGRDFKK